METKFTKGNWEVKEKTNLESTIYSNGIRICDVKSFGTDFETIDSYGNIAFDPEIEERIANEKLIASAPEMFEELVKIMETYDKGTETYIRVMKLLTKITE